MNSAATVAYAAVVPNSGAMAGRPLRDGQHEASAMDSEMLELERLQNMTGEAETHEAGAAGMVGGVPMTQEQIDKDEADRRSIYVGNVDYASTPQELQDHFRSCGQINRITIMVDKYTGHPKGYAYIEFAGDEAVQHAMLLNDTIFRERQLKVLMKRKNLPAFVLRGRGGAYRSRPYYRGVGGPPAYATSYRGRGARGMYRPFYRGRGGFTRGYGRPY